MQFLKVTCTQCMHYKGCPQKTRLFVNYCGSDRKRVVEQIKDAELECRAKRGYMFRREPMEAFIIGKNLSLSL